MSTGSGCAGSAEGRKALLRQSRPAHRRSTRAHDLSEQGCTWKHSRWRKSQSTAHKTVPKDRRACKSERAGGPVQSVLHQSEVSTGKQTKETQNEPFCWNRGGPALRHATPCIPPGPINCPDHHRWKACATSRPGPLRLPNLNEHTSLQAQRYMAVRHHRLRCLDLENLFRKGVDRKAAWNMDVIMHARAAWNGKTGSG